MKLFRWFFILVAFSFIFIFSIAVFHARDALVEETFAASATAAEETTRHSSSSSATDTSSNSASPVPAADALSLSSSTATSSYSSSSQLRPILHVGPVKSISPAAMEVLTRHPVGKWPQDCTCKTECLAQGERDAAALGDVQSWGPVALEILLNATFAPFDGSAERNTITSSSSSSSSSPSSSLSSSAATTTTRAPKPKKKKKTNSNSTTGGDDNETETPAFAGRGFSAHDIMNMISCRYRVTGSMNPTGAWLHISGRNVTVLRHLIDGYARSRKIIDYVKSVVARVAEPFLPLSVYIATTDLPCNPQLPFLTFFQSHGVNNIVIPDDTMHGTHVAQSWGESRQSFIFNKSNNFPAFKDRMPKLFFRGSPSHPLREQTRKALKECCSNVSDFRLAVMEKFKSEQVKLRDHTKYRYLAALRGRSASSRDKYLMLMNSSVFWVQEDRRLSQYAVADDAPAATEIMPPPHDSDAEKVEMMMMKKKKKKEKKNENAVAVDGGGDEKETDLVTSLAPEEEGGEGRDRNTGDPAAAADDDDDKIKTTAAAAAAAADTKKKKKFLEPEPTPFQFYHSLWLPYVNYVPLHPKNAQCTLSLANDNYAAMENIAKRGLDLGIFLTQEVADEYLVRVLRRYQQLQRYTVEPDPIDYLASCHRLAKRKYKDVSSLYAGFRWHVKFSLSRWLRMRTRQLQSCRKNSTNTFNARWRPYDCWYM